MCGIVCFFSTLLMLHDDLTISQWPPLRLLLLTTFGRFCWCSFWQSVFDDSQIKCFMRYLAVDLCKTTDWMNETREKKRTIIKTIFVEIIKCVCLRNTRSETHMYVFILQLICVLRCALFVLLHISYYDILSTSYAMLFYVLLFYWKQFMWTGAHRHTHTDRMADIGFFSHPNATQN